MSFFISGKHVHLISNESSLFRIYMDCMCPSVCSSVNILEIMPSTVTLNDGTLLSSIFNHSTVAITRKESSNTIVMTFMAVVPTHSMFHCKLYHFLEALLVAHMLSFPVIKATVTTLPVRLEKAGKQRHRKACKGLTFLEGLQWRG